MKKEKREKVNEHNPSETVGQGWGWGGGEAPICTNAVALMEEVTCNYRWMLVRASADALRSCRLSAGTSKS